MEAGKLNKKITIQKPVKTKSRMGQEVTEWQTVCTTWSDMICTDSKAATQDGVIVHEGLYRFRIRWQRGLTAEMRVIFKDGDTERIFPLAGPPANWEGNRDGLTLLCKELG